MTSVGIPRPAEDEEEEDEDSEDEDDQLALSSSFHQPQAVLNESGSSSAGLVPLPDTMRYYGFELKEPSDRDREIYERFVHTGSLTGRVLTGHFL